MNIPRSYKLTRGDYEETYFIIKTIWWIGATKMIIWMSIIVGIKYRKSNQSLE